MAATSSTGRPGLVGVGGLAAKAAGRRTLGPLPDKDLLLMYSLV